MWIRLPFLTLQVELNGLGRSGREFPLGDGSAVRAGFFAAASAFAIDRSSASVAKPTNALLAASAPAHMPVPIAAVAIMVPANCSIVYVQVGDCWKREGVCVQPLSDKAI